MDRVCIRAETRVPGFGSALEIGEMGLRQVEQGFFSKDFGIFDDISKWSMP